MSVPLTMAQKTFVCPICKTTVPAGHSTCPECQEDLRPLILVQNLGPTYYNEGLQLARTGRTKQAMERLLTALVFAPAHLDTLVVLGKLHAQHGRYDEAISYWQRTLEVEPSHRKALAGIQKVKELQQQTQRKIVWQRALAIVSVFVLLLLGSGATVGFQRLKTPRLVEQIALAVKNNSLLSDAKVDVKEQSGQFILTGEVPSEHHRDIALALVQGLVGSDTPVNTQDLSIQVSTSLAQAVEQAFATDPEVAGLDLRVRQVNDGVYLSGHAPTLTLKEQAEQVAKQIGQVTWIDSTGIEITPPDLTAIIKQALQDNPQTAALALQMQQEQNNIRLSGVVSTTDSKFQVETIARNVPGVHFVDITGLTVISPPFAEEVEHLLTTNPQVASSNILVEQVGDSIRLSGRVLDREQKELAEALASEVVGVEFVDTHHLLITPLPLLESVHQALQADSRTANLMIEIEQVEHNLRLKGKVSTLTDKIAVETIVHRVNAVELVDSSQLLVEPPWVPYWLQAKDAVDRTTQWLSNLALYHSLFPAK